MLKNSALILHNLQIDYCPGGAMEVPDANQIIPIANKLMLLFDRIIAVIDWHPANHISFAGNHPWRHIGQTISIDGLDQELLPFHCVQDSFGAHFYPKLNQENIHQKIYLGTQANLDNYSCFFDADNRRKTELFNYLENHKIENLFILGLAIETGIKNSALDAINLGFKTFLIADACKGWEKRKGDIKSAWQKIENAGGIMVSSQRIINSFVT